MAEAPQSRMQGAFPLTSSPVLYKDVPASEHALSTFEDMQRHEQHRNIGDPRNIHREVDRTTTTDGITATQQSAPFSNSNCILKPKALLDPQGDGDPGAQLLVPSPIRQSRVATGSLFGDNGPFELPHSTTGDAPLSFIEQQPTETSFNAVEFDGVESMEIHEEDREDRQTPESQGSIDEPFIPPQSPKYELRAGVRSSINLTTWVDKDDSGNYDPSEKNRRLVAKKRSLSTGGVVRDKRAREEGPREFKRMTLLSARQNGARLPVTLKVSTDEGKKRLSAFTSVDGEGEFATWEEKYCSTLPQIDADDAYSDSGTWEGRRTRAQNRYNNIIINETADANFIPDPLMDGEEVWTQDNLSGHPAARGCVACRKLNTPCSLLAPDASYPCIECQHVEEDCVLLTPALKKLPCLNCTGKKRCSYANPFGDHSLPCELCQQKGLDCVAGPAHRGRPRRVTYKDELGETPLDSWMVDVEMAGMHQKRPTPRRFIHCTYCRESGSRCSLKKDDEPPCKACKEDGLECTFEPKARVHKGKAPMRNKTENDVIAGAKEPLDRDGDVIFTGHGLGESVKLANGPVIFDAQGRGGPTTTITTALCHPVSFNYQDADPNACSWCRHPAFGLFGLGEIEIDVIQWSDGLGYTELFGGHAKHNDHSRMCCRCTYNRLIILFCAEHIMKELENASDDADVLEILTRTVEAQPQPKDQWCSVCIFPAKYRCCTSCQSGDDQVQEGCGLLLCGGCYRRLEQYGGDLQRVLTECKDFDKAGETMGWRADTEFLKSDSLLTRNVQAAP